MRHLIFVFYNVAILTGDAVSHEFDFLTFLKFFQECYFFW